jgi:hypothetical protein
MRLTVGGSQLAVRAKPCSGNVIGTRTHIIIEMGWTRCSLAANRQPSTVNDR